jgi:phosphatidylglycerol---prolipoprotein diacylglyceryl transferase
MMPVLNIGGLAIQSRGLLLVLAMALSLWVAERFARQGSVREELVSTAGITGLLVALVAARLVYALQHLSSYLRDPAALFSLAPQALAWPEGLLLGLLAAVVYLHRQQVAPAPAADAFVPALAAFWLVAGLGAFLSGDAYGQPTTLPWGVYLWGDYRHPVQLYETVAGALVLLLLARLVPRAPYPGWLALVGIALLGAARLFVEGFRADAALLAGLRVAQLWSLALVLLSLWVLYRIDARHGQTV